VDGSKQRPELLDGEPRVADDSAHREGVHRIVARDGDNPGDVGHDDVFALTSDSEPGLLEGLDSCEVVDARYPRHR
jgi:hypothetical protein